MAQQSPLDTRLASLGLLLGAGMIGYSFYKSRQGVGPLSAGPVASSASEGVSRGGPSAPPSTLSSYPLDRLMQFAQSWGLTVTSGYRPGANSLHGEGRAIDVAVPSADVADRIKAAAEMQGIHVFPEAPGQRGANGSVSTGFHWHLSFPEMKNGRWVF